MDSVELEINSLCHYRLKQSPYPIPPLSFIADVGDFQQLDVELSLGSKAKREDKGKEKVGTRQWRVRFFLDSLVKTVLERMTRPCTCQSQTRDAADHLGADRCRTSQGTPTSGQQRRRSRLEQCTHHLLAGKITWPYSAKVFLAAPQRLLSGRLSSRVRTLPPGVWQGTLPRLFSAGRVSAHLE
ncbi:unnamed protein product [Tetraodon nigroviridis]|uniref:(spotted green pufferfish) hypothetical protein n=1 Tax=Tetraodon nigroviridis TaxID=99883 RepID=Q4RPW9_TETNG|nr:unnamed protein product [Tetraodon nigroviridis]